MAKKKKPKKARPKNANDRRNAARRAARRKVAGKAQQTRDPEVLDLPMQPSLGELMDRLAKIEAGLAPKPSPNRSDDKGGNVNEMASILADRTNAIGNRIASLCHRLGIAYPGCDAPQAGCDRTSVAPSTLRTALVTIGGNLDGIGALLDALEKNT